VKLVNMRARDFILVLLVLAASHSRLATAQAPANPTPDQLMQLMRSQPGVDLSAPVTATAVFDPPQVRPGEKAVYRVTFNATAVSVNWPEKIPAPTGLAVKFNCSGQTMQAAGGAYENFAAFDYDVHAAAAGQFSMPEFTVEVYGKPVVIPAAQLEVKMDLPEPYEPVRQLLVVSSASNIYVGEKFDVSVILPATAAGAIEGVSDVQFNGDSFVVDNQLTRQSIQSVAMNGRNTLAYVYKTGLTPIAAGKLNLSVQGFSLETQAGGPPKIVLLDSEPVVINVRPLPVENELAGFQGAVGDYTCDPPILTKSNLKVGEPTQLTIVIHGRGDPARINPPLPSRVEGWQMFPAERAGRPGGARMPGVNFRYTLIPLTDAVHTTPAIPFSCFNPASGGYIDLTIPALPVTVFAGENQTNADTGSVFPEDNLEPEPKAGLSKLAQTPGWTGDLVPLQMRGWFPLVHTFPALGFCGLWYWNRRRHFLEQHPEIVRRREARRGLRRERRRLEKSAAKKDAAGFVRSAINALQIASAPHYQAEPRALVCSDVLQILTAEERGGKSGEMVRHFFAAADAAVFANSSDSQTPLLTEREALKIVLLKLEARL
jgi:hypothetical protein